MNHRGTVYIMITYVVRASVAWRGDGYTTPLSLPVAYGVQQVFNELFIGMTGIAHGTEG
jgi:hypothetical protein